MQGGDAERGVGRGRQIAERAMRPDGVVVVFPSGEHRTGVGERDEQRLVQKLIPEAAVKALDEGVLLRLAGRDVVPGDRVVLAPAQDRHTGELGAVVGHDAQGPSAESDDAIELACNAHARDRSIGRQAEAFTREVVDDCQDPEPPAVGEAVADEVQGPALVRPLRHRQRCARAERPLASATAADLKPFLAVEPPQLLVVQHDPLPPQQDCTPSA